MGDSTLVISSPVCYHCGEQCLDLNVPYDEKSFCCEGCKTAYQILSESDLCSYYDLESHPGINLKSSKTRSRFDYLEDDEVILKLADYQDQQHLHLSLYIPNIHCTSCVWLLENLQKLDPGVYQSQVNFLKRELQLKIQTDKTSLRRVIEQLTTIGYEPEIRLNQMDEKKQSTHPNRSLWLKLGVAGFAFGNIMLFSFPDYLDVGNSGLGSNFHVFFGVLNIILAIPVLLYSSRDYLKSAFAALSQGGVNLDVPITIGITALFGRSIYEILSGTGTGYLDSFTGLIFFLLIGKLIQQKTFDRLSFDRDYKSYLPIAVNVQNEDGTESSITLDRLTPGLTMRLRNQELVPCDSILISDRTYVDYSFITGESDPVEVKKGGLIYAGARLSDASALFRTQQEVVNSYLTKLWNHEAFQSQDKELNLSSFADKVSPYFTVAVLFISAAAGLYWYQSAGMEQALSVFTAVLIIACPCALALSTPFTLGSALNILSTNGLFVRNPKLLESLSKATELVFDKTGTLTTKNQSTVTFFGADLSDHQSKLIKTACSQSIHPVSRRIHNYLEGVDTLTSDSFFELSGKGIFTAIDGHFLCLGSASFLKEQNPDQQLSIPDVEFEGSLTHLAIDGSYIGAFGIKDGLRAGIPALLQKLKDSFNTYLISGDNDTQKSRFTDHFEGQGSLLFHQSPEEKLSFIQQLQDQGQKVVMVGDGLNDAGALKQSDFGIALSDDISSFSPACDAIIEGKALFNLLEFIQFSKYSMRIILASFGLSLLYNIVGLGFAITGHLSPLVAAILMPLSSISVMLFTFLTTRIVAKSQGLSIWK